MPIVSREYIGWDGGAAIGLAPPPLGRPPSQHYINRSIVTNTSDERHRQERFISPWLMTRATQGSTYQTPPIWLYPSGPTIPKTHTQDTCAQDRSRTLGGRRRVVNSLEDRTWKNPIRDPLLHCNISSA